MTSPTSIRGSLRNLGAFVAVAVGLVIVAAPRCCCAKTITVTSDADDGFGTLRQALNNAQSGDSIAFAITGTVEIHKPLVLPDQINILGPGARSLRLHSNGADALLFIDGGVSAFVGDLTLSGGYPNVLCTKGLLTIRNCTLTESKSGNVQIGAAGVVDMRACTISGNSSLNDGGGISSLGKLDLSNSTISGNEAVNGGGINIGGGSAYLTYCTISDNGATAGNGGGIVRQGGTVNLLNTIVAGNSASAAGPDLFGAFASSGNNFIGQKDGSTGFTNNVNHDIVGTTALPRLSFLSPLHDNGGPTDTMELGVGSIAVNNAGTSVVVNRDQRGFIRPDAADIGAYEVNATQPHTLGNISTRLDIETGDNVLIGGFIVTGVDPKNVLVRAIGPSLGLPGQIADPLLELYDSSSQLIATNDNWQTASNQQAIANTQLAPTNDAESAILMSLVPGAYTTVVRGAAGGTGVGLVDAYDIDRTSNHKLANISTRGTVQTGDGVLIGGFFVLGADAQKVIARAIGPSLGVPGALADPTLELFDSNGTSIAFNDNWKSSQQMQIFETGIPPTNDFEAAVVLSLDPGAYTALVRGKDNGMGIALVEIYGIN